jgi:hypothetical protein
MARHPNGDETPRAADARRESGLPGGGAGRRDEVGGSGVYPASAGRAPAGAEVRTQAAWGQGERGAAGAEDAGSSEIFYYPVSLEAAGVEPESPETAQAEPDEEC